MVLTIKDIAWIVIGIVIIAVFIDKKSKDFMNTDYYKCTARPWLYTFFLGKGNKGEYLTYNYLKSIKGYKRFLFNCYVPKENEETTEIDVIMLHETGILVFESKNYSGWIFGNEDTYKWTQALRIGRRTKKVQFLNPIIQNKGHIKWLKSLLEDETIPYFSYIVFSERCTLKDITIHSSDQKVMNRDLVKASVNKVIETHEAIFNKERIDELFDILYPLTQADAEAKAKHIEQIRTHKLTKKVKKENIEEEIKNDIEERDKLCPKCGNKLVLRKAKRGANAGRNFYGCSNYPKCKYIEKIEEEMDASEQE